MISLNNENALMRLIAFKEELKYVDEDTKIDK